MEEIMFDKTAFMVFNKDDYFGIFDDKINRIVNGLGRIDPSSTSLFDYDEYIKKLMINLFVRYHDVVVTEADCIFGIVSETRILLKSNAEGAFQLAKEFFNVERTLPE